MTYKIGPFYVTSLVMPMPMFKYKDSEKHPGIVSAIAITTTKDTDDYHYLSHHLKKKGKMNSLVYGTDGEPAIEKAFEAEFPIEGKTF